MGSISRRLLQFVLGVAVGSLVFEVYLRAAEATALGRILPVAEVSLYGPSAATGYTHRAGARGIWATENRAPIEINALGLRDAIGRTQQKPAGTRRVAIVGDSFVEALQVPWEDTFVSLIEQQLDGGRNGRIEVINLGLAGATPAVIAERLKAEAPRLDLDAAVIVVSGGDLARPRWDDTSEFPGYVSGADGKAVLSHAFRDGRGYGLRISAVGQAIYWAVDHVRLALVLNNRKNAGLMADLSPPAHRATTSPTDCSERTRFISTVLSSTSTDDIAGARLDAFLVDAAAVSRKHQFNVILAIRGLDGNCATRDPSRAEVSTLIAKRVANAGLGFLDVDLAIQPLLEGRSPRDLHGFGARLGSGHLNQHGHRVYAAVFGDLVLNKLLNSR